MRFANALQAISNFPDLDPFFSSGVGISQDFTQPLHFARGWSESRPVEVMTVSSGGDL